MNRAVDAYLAELDALRFSHSRRYHVARTLERLLLYLRETHSISDWRTVNETHLRDFAVYAATRHRTPKGRPISAATLRQWLSIIRSFFVWLNRTGHLLHNPAERLAFTRKEQTLPHVLNESDYLYYLVRLHLRQIVCACMQMHAPVDKTPNPLGVTCLNNFRCAATRHPSTLLCVSQDAVIMVLH